jgi:hypothetical protein
MDKIIHYRGFSIELEPDGLYAVRSYRSKYVTSYTPSKNSVGQAEQRIDQIIASEEAKKEKKNASCARARAKHQGLILVQSRCRELSTENLGLYRIIDATTKNIVAGKHYDLSAGEANCFFGIRSTLLDCRRKDLQVGFLTPQDWRRNHPEIFNRFVEEAIKEAGGIFPDWLRDLLEEDDAYRNSDAYKDARQNPPPDDSTGADWWREE